MTLTKIGFGYGFLIVLSICLVFGLSQNLKLGWAINLFERFGYLHITMRVMPRNDTKWIFREPSVEIFKDIESMKKTDLLSEGNSVFHGNFNMFFCDDLHELFKIYFQEFSIERLDEPWEAFLENFSNETLAYNLGINVSYVSGDHCYVLVKITRVRDKISFLPEFEALNASVNQAVLDKADTVKLGDMSSLWGFVKTFGSHYITSYATGNSMYQVIVYSQKIYKKLRDKIEKASGFQSLSNEEINFLFSPQFAEHMGNVLTSSGNETLLDWAEESLNSSYTVPADPPYKITYSNLLKLYRNSKLLKQLEVLLGNEALLHLKLMTVGPVFKDKQIRDWFLEVLDNNLKLWEVN